MRWRVAGALAIAGGVLAPVGTAAAQTPGPRAVEVATMRDARITESSGLALSAARRDVVWTVNDSGSAALVYGVSLRTGRTEGVLRLIDSTGRPADVVDTESLASARAGPRRSLLVGDIGDNRRTRDHVTIWRVAEPSAVRDAAPRAARLDVRYAGGPADAEALVMTPDGRLLVITKAVLRADVYEVPQAAVRRLLAGRDGERPVTARLVTRIAQTLVTGADALPDGRLLVRDYGAATVYRWQDGDLVGEAQVPLPRQKQGEAIVVEPGGRTALVSSEGVDQPLWRVSVPKSVAGQPVSSAATASAPPAARRPSAVAEPSARPLVALLGLGAVAAAAVAVGLRAARRRGRRRP